MNDGAKMGDYVNYTSSGVGIVTIGIDRPQRLNAKAGDVCSDLAGGFIRFAEDDDSFVAILTGTGRAFFAGMDICESVERGNTTMLPPDISSLVNPF